MTRDLLFQQLVAHLSDYIQLMDQMFPNQQDAVKSRARALLSDCINAWEVKHEDC